MGPARKIPIYPYKGRRRRKADVYKRQGMDLVKHFQAIKDIIGYVPQQDIIYENLTLKKMLFYTAKMKMSEDTSREEIKRRIDAVSYTHLILK